MSFFCPHCNTENGAGKIWLGMVIHCPACSRELTLSSDIHMGASKSSEVSEGYAVTFQDFCLLLADEEAMKKTKPVLEKLLDCSVERFSDRYVLKRKGMLVPFEIAHLNLQLDADKQREFYNLTMWIWR